jgi:hypothetical protein
VSPDAHVTGGGDVLGGTDSFAAALARERAAVAAKERKRTAGLSQRLEAFNAAEEAKMAALRALLGDGGGLARRD